MAQIPAVDPIPLPAPVWLFKLLHLVTFALHLTAVDLLLGGIAIGLGLHLAGRMRKSAAMTQSSGLLAHRLPVLMAYVINLGVPPLLFAQVLYGRALYTSSVLIGTYWISVIFLLMACYYALYVASRRAETRKGWGSAGIASLILALAIAFIYSNNMTLMLRPQVWSSMYHASPMGLQLNSSDPTLMPRWLFFVSGAFPVAGAALMLIALKTDLDDSTRTFLRRFGGVMIAAMVVVQAAFGQQALAMQPAGVVGKVMSDALYRPFAYGWVGTAALLLAFGLLTLISGRLAAVVATGSALLAFLNVACEVLVRDGIRDYTLRAAGFEVWDRTVVSNWSVVVIFLVLFVGALGAIGYLAWVVSKMRRVEEKYV
jgi:hypothetical protein